MSASIWNPGGTLIPQVDPNSQIKSETFTAIAGQTLFTLTTFTYILGVGALSVYRNGVKQVGTDVTETSTSSITLAACEAGDVIEVVGNTAIADPTGAAAAAAVSAAEAAASAASAAASAAAITLPLPAASGGTGLGSLAALKAAMALDNVTNTSDAAKPVSTATQAALDVHTTALTLRVTKDSDTGAMKVPVGTTAQRPVAPTYGDTRVNSTTGSQEWWNGSSWVAMGGGAVGGGGNAGFYLNDQIIDVDYAIPTSKNAMTAGPITVANGITVTVPDGATWTIVG